MMPLHHDQFEKIWEAVRPYTMVARGDLIATIGLALSAIDAGRKGPLVECGTWRGGCSFAMLLAQREAYGCVQRPVYMLDSFEGLPPAEDKDGAMALAYSAGQLPPDWYKDNCRADEEGVREAAKRFEFTDWECRIVKGWFKWTAPPLARELASTGIAMLRLDGDWYASTMTCLNHFAPLVADQSGIIIDDYYAWDGCARAVHEYLVRKKIIWRIRSIPDGGGAYTIKNQSHWADGYFEPTAPQDSGGNPKGDDGAGERS